MFERYLTDALATHFGHVIEDLDQDKVRLSAWNGEVVLKDLKIQKNAIDNILRFDQTEGGGTVLPVEIAYGHIGHLEIRLPWKQLVRSKMYFRSKEKDNDKQQSTSSPELQLDIILSDIDILISPKRRRESEGNSAPDITTSVQEEGDFDIDLPKREKLIQTALDAEIMDRITASSKNQQTSSSKDDRNPSWIQERIASILSNLSVTIKNIHIRYEDPGTCVGFDWKICNHKGVDDTVNRYHRAFAVGITLHEFSIQSYTLLKVENGNSTANEATNNENSAILRQAFKEKVVSVNQIASYWDSDCSIIMSDRGKLLDQDLERKYFQSIFCLLNGGSLPSNDFRVFPGSKSKIYATPHTYLLKPFSPSFHVSVSDSALAFNSSAPPISELEISMPPCHFVIARNILEDLGYLRKSVDTWSNSKKGFVLPETTLRRIAKLKPVDSPLVSKICVREWWKYAFEAVLSLQTVSNKGPSTKKIHQRKGWIGLAQGLGYRKRYVALFLSFLQQSNENELNTTHDALMKLENNLSIQEILYFRIATFEAFQRLPTTSDNEDQMKYIRLQIREREAIDDGLHSVPVHVTTATPEYRLHMFIEMAQGLERERKNSEEMLINVSSNNEKNVNGIIWKSSLRCPDFSVQVNEISEQMNFTEPIVRLSFALKIEHELCSNDAWNLTCRVGSLVMQDCTCDAAEGTSLFPNLIGLKKKIVTNIGDTHFCIDDSKYDQSVLVNIRRSWQRDSSTRVGYTTSTSIRILPMEFVYSTSPFESLSRLLYSAHVELADDYLRLSNRLAHWRHRQQKRLIQALAHKHKTICIDVNIGAPVILIPESTILNSHIFIVHLGDLQFFNNGNATNERKSDYDDIWHLHLANIHLQCTSTYSYQGFEPTAASEHLIYMESKKLQQLIEPFSLSFSILTRFNDETDPEGDVTTVISTHITLPSLVFNITSSVVYLLRKIQSQWIQRKHDVQRLASSSTVAGPKTKNLSSAIRYESTTRRLVIHFDAPLFRIKFENDVNGRDHPSITPLFDFVLNGIECTLLRVNDFAGDIRLQYTAKVHSLRVFDLYQTGPKDFALLMSSISPHLVAGHSDVESAMYRSNEIDLELVTVEYSSFDRADVAKNLDDSIDELKINFNELYVEWNPETVAAINVAISVPTGGAKVMNIGNDNHTRIMPEEAGKSYSDDEGDVFYDAPSDSENEDEREGITEASATNYTILRNEQLPSEPDLAFRNHNDSTRPIPEVTKNVKHFHVSFSLSKLRMSFNKDSRHRKLFVAEMDSTFIQFTKYEARRSKASFTMGNLTFVDCESMKHKTLYREILGLTTDRAKEGSEPSSLLQMEITIQERTRCYVEEMGTLEDDENQTDVAINVVNGEVYGFDTYLRATLSPMRFVFIQQLWLEIVDYIFEGILGNEVWGVKPPSPVDLDIIATSKISADMIYFTRFNIEMLSPVILLPVASCSTDFVRIEASCIHIQNSYSHGPIRNLDHVLSPLTGTQWFNTCKIKYENLHFKNSSGIELNDHDNRPHASVFICWPVGPKAILNMPKWEVDCKIDFLNLSLNRDDYALLQNIVQMNIGEETRHLDEWKALQSLPGHLRSSHEKKILVQYSYDRKDVIPSTFGVKLECPTISLSLSRSNNPFVATVRCLDLSWEFKKLKDRISHQSVSCNIEILNASTGRMLLSSGRLRNLDRSRNLSYVSSVKPCGETSKSVEIIESCIYLDYSDWKLLSIFFQNLPQPTFLMPNQVIQVGDRWYKIGLVSSLSVQEEDRNTFQWLDGYDKTTMTLDNPEMNVVPYGFCFVLRNPAVEIMSPEASLVLTVDTISLKHNREGNRVFRDLVLIAVVLKTKTNNQLHQSPESSLIQAWDLNASVNESNSLVPSFNNEIMTKIHAETMKARVTFSDLCVVMEVGLHFMKEVKATNENDQDYNMRRFTDDGTAETESDTFIPMMKVLDVVWLGFDLVLIDDSHRHFAHDQSLILVGSESILLRSETEASSTTKPCSRSMHIVVCSFRMIDCLQSESSPFRELIRFQANQCCSPEGSSSCSSNVDTGKILRRLPKMTIKGEYSPVIEFWSDIRDEEVYGIRMGSLKIQYNPSVVVTLQRFLGRLTKGFKNQIAAGATPSIQKLNGDDTHFKHSVISLFVDVAELKVSLNKEHQGRCLADVSISDVLFDLYKCGEGCFVKGSIGDFTASNAGSMIAESSKRDSRFIQFHYWLFTKKIFQDSSRIEGIPKWIVEQDDAIDDILDVSLSTLEIIYVRSIFDELLDYLGNGMPGKGMGVTSRAAKGFVKERIQKKSFFNIRVNAPKLTIPVSSEQKSQGVSCRLGDFHLKSWIQASPSHTKINWSPSPRIIIANLSGVAVGVYSSIILPEESRVVSSIDVSLHMEISSNSISISSKISDVKIRLTYIDYLSCLLVVKRNIGKKPNVKEWDNLETAWEKETAVGIDFEPESREQKSEVVYSSSVRLIRYGRKSSTASVPKGFIISFFFSSLSLLLHRNDLQDEIAYDILLVRCQGFDAVFEQKVGGEQSANISLSKCFVFDLGKAGRGRVSTDSNYGGAPVVMVKEYFPKERQDAADKTESDNPQIVLKFDNDTRENGVARITVVVSYLSVAPMISSLLEVSNFLNCKWPSPTLTNFFLRKSVPMEEATVSDINFSRGKDLPRVQKNIQLHVVLHYPQLVLVVDEDDVHSRALVLRCLAIANASQDTVTTESAESTSDFFSTTKVNADLQNVSSFINPDVSTIVSLTMEQLEVVRDFLSARQVSETKIDHNVSNADDIPILLPLTIGVDFEQIKENTRPTFRVVSINFDPLSIIFTNEDIYLLKAVATKMTAKSLQERKLSDDQEIYDVVFHSIKLGLGLQKDVGRIVVDSIGDTEKYPLIKVGDALYAINDDIVIDAAETGLSSIVRRLTLETRPLKLSFLRSDVHIFSENRVEVSKSSNQEMAECGIVNKIDVSLAAAVLTLMERDAPLLKGSLCSAKLSLYYVQGLETKLNLDVSTAIYLDYYNLHVWGWEPFLEPGDLSFTASYNDLNRDVAEFVVEVGDRGTGLILNISDSLMETISKGIQWGNTKDEGTEVDLDLSSYPVVNNIEYSFSEQKPGFSNEAANAALRYARRPKTDTLRPFVFKNRSGLSAAFVRQRKLETRSNGTIPEFESVGVYAGLENYDRLEVMIVANEEELNFRLDVSSDEKKVDRDNGEKNFSSRLLLLSVSLQEANGCSAHPFTDLQVSHPGVKLLPLSTSHIWNESSKINLNKGMCAVWSVEQIEEKMILTFGSSIRIFSSINKTLEVGVRIGTESDYSDVKCIGVVHAGELLYLPLWLGMLQKPWECFIRPSNDFQYSSILGASSDGVVSFGADRMKAVECCSVKNRTGNLWLKISKQTDFGILTISIECAISLRNLLPTDIEIEAKQKKYEALDIHLLKSGEHAEFFCLEWRSLSLRVRPKAFGKWSSWLPLSSSLRGAEDNSERDGEDVYVEERSLLIHVDDFMNAQLPVGVRISIRQCGIDVILYADLWLTNSTQLPLIFGCHRDFILESKYISDSKIFEPPDLSTAEAALKEISALFETGYDVSGLSDTERRIKLSSRDIIRLADQAVPFLIEEYFEYKEIDGSKTNKHWWATEAQTLMIQSLGELDPASDGLRWLEENWKIDETGRTFEGWESSSDSIDFPSSRSFNPYHRFRRRRWMRSRSGSDQSSHVDAVNAYVHSPTNFITKEGNLESTGIRIALKVDGGKFAVTSNIPREGTSHGVIRVMQSRWPGAVGIDNNDENGDTLRTTAFELCYTVSPLQGDWGIFSRSMIFTSRFLIRNDSSKFSLQVKQAGAADATAIEVKAMQTIPFHWADFRIPELVTIRPLVRVHGQFVYKWSGGFDPLTIGSIPLRMRKRQDTRTIPIGTYSIDNHKIKSIKMEAEIRSRTGGTGINLSFQEEDESGSLALFCLENRSTFPIWFQQEGVLSDPSTERDEAERDGDLLRPSESSVAALDVPFRQGKYSNRQAATVNELLRFRIGLAPLSSRAGIETVKSIALTTVGQRIYLNPSKLLILPFDLRASLEHVRIVGSIRNDGPTRVLSFCLAERYSSEVNFDTPFSEVLSIHNFFGVGQPPDLPPFGHEIFDGAFHAAKLSSKKLLPSVNESAANSFTGKVLTSHFMELDSINKAKDGELQTRDIIISVRVSLSGLVVSLIDSAPTEVAVLSFKNMNGIASWNTKRTNDSTIFITMKGVQVDNMLPNAPFDIAICPDDSLQAAPEGNRHDSPPLLVIGMSLAPRHKSGIVCLKSVTIAPRNLAIRVDLAFVARLQKFVLGIFAYFQDGKNTEMGFLRVPDIHARLKYVEEATSSGVDRQKFFFGSLTILPCNIKLSVAPARALTSAQACLEGEVAAAIHQAVRKGDVRLDHGSLLGVKLGSRNKTPLAVMRGMLKSFVVDALLRLDGASLNFAGVVLSNHTSTGSQLKTALGAHYMASLRHNLPALVGSMAAFGNPLGLFKGLGDGVSDFVLEPVKGFQRSVQEMDASYLVDGVAKGTLSLARHTVGGFADSAALLAETFSKNMTVLTLDRRYAQKRDRGELLRDHNDINVALGLGSGVQKLANGFIDGVTGVVKAPIRGAERHGLEGFAKGIGKGLLGLLVKPIIGISDGFSDVMIGVKGSVEGVGGHSSVHLTQVRPRRAMYGRDRSFRVYNVADAAAAALMQRTRLAGECYVSHLDMGDRVALLSVKRLLIIGHNGKELLVVKFSHIESLEHRMVTDMQGQPEWGIIILLNTPRSNGSEIEVITFQEKALAEQLYRQIKRILEEC